MGIHLLWTPADGKMCKTNSPVRALVLHEACRGSIQRLPGRLPDVSLCDDFCSSLATCPTHSLARLAFLSADSQAGSWNLTPLSLFCPQSLLVSRQPQNAGTPGPSCLGGQVHSQSSLLDAVPCTTPQCTPLFEQYLLFGLVENVALEKLILLLGRDTVLSVYFNRKQ